MGNMSSFDVLWETTGGQFCMLVNKSMLHIKAYVNNLFLLPKPGAYCNNEIKNY